MKNFFAELKRRNVYKVAVAYAVASWLIIQVATQVFPFFEIPNWAVRLVVLLLIAGFPVALIFSWAFEITPEGIKRESEIASDKSDHPSHWPQNCCPYHRTRGSRGGTARVPVVAIEIHGDASIRLRSERGDYELANFDNVSRHRKIDCRTPVR